MSNNSLLILSIFVVGGFLLNELQNIRNSIEDLEVTTDDV